MIKSLFALMPAFLVAYVPLAGAAAAGHFQCDATMIAGSEHTRRLLTVDLDHATVEDGPMRFHNGDPMLVRGSPLPFANPDISFVRHAGQKVEWGSRKPATDEIVLSFSLNVATGDYMFSGADSVFATGRCRALPNSI